MSATEADDMSSEKIAGSVTTNLEVQIIPVYPADFAGEVERFLNETRSG
jgi:hypothetical protein